MNNPHLLANALALIVARAPAENSSAYYLPAQLMVMSAHPQRAAARHVFNRNLERLRGAASGRVGVP